jgi:hypothetical protein
VTDKRKKFFEETLKRIKDHAYQKDRSFEEVYCSMEEGLVCMDGSCRDCGDEEVRKKDSSGAQERRRILKLTTILGICASTIFEMFWW